MYRIYLSYRILSYPLLSYLSIWFYLSISPYLAVCICIGSMNRFVWQRKTEFAKDNVQAIQQSSKIQLHSLKAWCNMCEHFPCFAYTFQPLISIYLQLFLSELSSYCNLSLWKSPLKKSTSCSYSYFVDSALRPGLLFEEGESWKLSKSKIRVKHG